MNGVLMERVLQSNPAQRYFLYMPTKCGNNAKLFVTVHGNSRNARAHAEQFITLSERYGVILVAPHFPLDRFPDYQLLGVSGEGERPDQALDSIVAEVSLLTGADAGLLYLLGFSGGAQFAHRYMMAYPAKVAKLVAAAAGWYTFPDSNMHYPSGVKPVAVLGDVAMQPEQFLKIPAFVFVGERDTERGKSLNQDPEVDERQGTTRVERGRRWIAAMQSAAADWGYDTDYRYVTVQGASHSLSQCMEQEQGRIGTLVFEFLFNE